VRNPNAPGEGKTMQLYGWVLLALAVVVLVLFFILRAKKK